MHLCSTGTGIFWGYTLRNGISDSRDMGINELIFVHLQSYQQCMDSVFDLAFLLTVDVINIIKIFAVIIFIPLEFQWGLAFFHVCSWFRFLSCCLFLPFTWFHLFVGLLLCCLPISRWFAITLHSGYYFFIFYLLSIFSFSPLLVWLILTLFMVTFVVQIFHFCVVKSVRSFQLDLSFMSCLGRLS